MMVNAYNHSTGESRGRGQEFKAILGYNQFQGQPGLQEIFVSNLHPPQNQNLNKGWVYSSMVAHPQ